MLEDLAAHVLDISENSVRANATKVIVEVDEDKANDKISFSVEDNGKGMTPEFLAKVTDPFTTTRTTRKVGMGLPFLKQSAELCNGSFEIKSKVGVGTKTKATFQFSCVDRPPLGDMPGTVMTLVMGSPDIHWIYRHKTNSGEYVLDTDEILEALDGDKGMLTTAEVGIWMRDTVKQGLEEINWDGGQ